MEETKTETKTEVDAKGVPLENRIKEMERKLQDKYDKELAALKQEQEAFKASLNAQDEPKPEDAAKEELLRFVKSPKDYIRGTLSETRFQDEIPQAENWLRSQKGYSKDDDDKIVQIIRERKLNNPYMSPRERAETAWEILESRKLREKQTSQTDDERREASIRKTSTEEGGRSTSVKTGPTRADLIKKLAEAESKGDLDKAIQLTSLLEDVR